MIIIVLYTQALEGYEENACRNTTSKEVKYDSVVVSTQDWYSRLYKSERSLPCYINTTDQFYQNEKEVSNT